MVAPSVGMFLPLDFSPSALGSTCEKAEEAPEFCSSITEVDRLELGTPPGVESLEALEAILAETVDDPKACIICEAGGPT